jgi:elongation factor Ts
MAEITAGMVKELREATGLGMMECKKALAEAGGDLKKAEELLRVKGGARASKMAGRLAAEGAVSVNISADEKTGALVEVNCETDFVAKDANFAGFVKAVAEAVAKGNPADLDALAESAGSDGQTMEAARRGLIMKIGENISVRRFVRICARGKLACYLHGRKIGVLVDYEGGDEQLGRDLAMHIAASKPICVSAEEVQAPVIAKEREIYAAQAKDSGKADQIIAKMIDGRVAKYLAEVTLLGQPFVKNPDQTVAKLLQGRGAKVHAFHMYVVGEGIEKKKDDFVAAVMAQAGHA